jgi:hypothetical protein
MISTLEPPASIRRLVDGRLGVYPVLCIPWGEEAASGHEHAGLVYSRGGVHQPRDPERPATRSPTNRSPHLTARHANAT